MLVLRKRPHGSLHAQHLDLLFPLPEYGCIQNLYKKRNAIIRLQKYWDNDMDERHRMPMDPVHSEEKE